MKPNIRHKLTDHARIRLYQRSSLSEEEFLALADKCAVLIYRADSMSHYELLWSQKDTNGYIIVSNPETGYIITIKRVLTAGGLPCKMHDWRRKTSPSHKDEPGVAEVKSSMLKQAVRAAGSDISEAKSIIDKLIGYEGRKIQKRSWGYRWTLRFLSNNPDGGVTPRTKVLGKETEIRKPPESIIEKANAAVIAAAGWDATLSLVERDSMKEVGQWDLAQARAL